MFAYYYYMSCFEVVRGNNWEFRVGGIRRIVILAVPFSFFWISFLISTELPGLGRLVIIETRDGTDALLAPNYGRSTLASGEAGCRGPP